MDQDLSSYQSAALQIKKTVPTFAPGASIVFKCVSSSTSQLLLLRKVWTSSRKPNDCIIGSDSLGPNIGQFGHLEVSCEDMCETSGDSCPSPRTEGQLAEDQANIHTFKYVQISQKCKLPPVLCYSCPKLFLCPSRPVLIIQSPPQAKVLVLFLACCSILTTSKSLEHSGDFSE